jgi:hypothetical protein
VEADPDVEEPFFVLGPLQGYPISLTIHNESPYYPTTGDTYQDNVRPEAFASLVPGTTNVIQLNNVLVGDHYTLGYSYQYTRTFLRMWLYNGHPTQVANQPFIAATASAGLFSQKWTSSDQLNGIPYAVFRFRVDPDVFPSGLDNIAFAVQGKVCFDARHGLHLYTENPIVHIRDYALAECGVQPGEINLNHHWTQANICDEAIPLIDPVTGVKFPPNMYGSPYTDANPHQHRYRCNAVLSTEASPLDNLGILLSSCDGSIVCSGSTFDIRAGAYEEPIVSLDESDLAGPPEVIKGMARPELFNGVRTRFANWRKVFWPMEDAMPYHSPFYAAQDKVEIIREIDLPATIDEFMANRISKQILHRARNGLRVRALFNTVGLQLAAEQMVLLNIQSLGISGAFRIKSYKPANLYQVEMELQEDSPSLYAWNFNEVAYDPTPNSRLVIPDFRSIPAVLGLGADTSAAVGVVQPNGEVSAMCRVFWSPVTDPYVLADGYIKVRYRKGLETHWTESPRLDPRQDEFRFPVKRGDFFSIQVQLATSLAKGKWTQIDKWANDAPTPILHGNYLANAAFEFVGQWDPPPFPFPSVFTGWSSLISSKGDAATMHPDISSLSGDDNSYDPNHIGTVIWVAPGIDDDLLQLFSTRMAVTPGGRVVAYAYHWSNVGFGYLGIAFTDANGNDAGYFQSTGIRSPVHPGGDITIDDFALDILFADVPSNAVSAYMLIFHFRESVPDSPSTVARWTRPYFGAASAGQLTVPIWRK